MTKHRPNKRRNPAVVDDELDELRRLLEIGDDVPVVAYRAETLKEKVDRLQTYATEQQLKQQEGDIGTKLTGGRKDQWWRTQVDRWIKEAFEAEDRDEQDILAVLMAAQRQGIKGNVKKEKIYGGVRVEEMKEAGANSGAAYLASYLFKTAPKTPFPDKDDLHPNDVGDFSDWVFRDIAYINWLPQLFESLQKGKTREEMGDALGAAVLNANARTIRYTLMPAVDATASLVSAIMTTPLGAFRKALLVGMGVDLNKYEEALPKAKETKLWTVLTEEAQAEYIRNIEASRTLTQVKSIGVIRYYLESYQQAEESKGQWRNRSVPTKNLPYMAARAQFYEIALGYTSRSKLDNDKAFIVHLKEQPEGQYTLQEDGYSLSELRILDDRTIEKVRSVLIRSAFVSVTAIGQILEHGPLREDTLEAKSAYIRRSIQDRYDVDAKTSGGVPDPHKGAGAVPNLSYFEKVESNLDIILDVLGINKKDEKADLGLLYFKKGNEEITLEEHFNLLWPRGEQNIQPPALTRHLQDPLSPTSAYSKDFTSKVVKVLKDLGKTRLTSGFSTALWDTVNYLNHPRSKVHISRLGLGPYSYAVESQILELDADTDPSVFAYGGASEVFVNLANSLYLTIDIPQNMRAKAVEKSLPLSPGEFNVLEAQDKQNIYVGGSYKEKVSNYPIVYMPLHQYTDSGADGTNLWNGNKTVQTALKFGNTYRGRGESASSTKRPTGYIALLGGLSNTLSPTTSVRDVVTSFHSLFVSSEVLKRIVLCIGNKKTAGALSQLDSYYQTVTNNRRRFRIKEGKPMPPPDPEAHAALSYLRFFDFIGWKFGKAALATARDQVFVQPTKFNRMGIPMLADSPYFGSAPYIERNTFRAAVGNEPLDYNFDEEIGYAVKPDAEPASETSWHYRVLRVNAPQEFQDWEWNKRGTKQKLGKYGVEELGWKADPPGRWGPDLPEGGVNELRQTGVTKIGFGGWVDNDITFKTFHIRGLFVGLWDLADFLGIPFSRMGRMLDAPTLKQGAPYENEGQNQWLKFGIGQRGVAGAAAHYESGGSEPNTINMTKLNGPGSLLHEMFHYIDGTLFKAIMANGYDGPKPFWPQTKVSPFMATALFYVAQWKFPRVDVDFKDVKVGETTVTDVVEKANEITSEGSIHLPFYAKDDEDEKGYRLIKYDDQTPEQQEMGNMVLATLWRLMYQIYGTANIQPNRLRYPGYHSDFALRAGLLGIGYYASPWEMFARASEAYAADWFTERNRNSSYLVERGRTQVVYGIKEVKVGRVKRKTREIIYIYPQNTYYKEVITKGAKKEGEKPEKDTVEIFKGEPMERVRINAAFDLFIQAFSTYAKSQYCDDTPFSLDIQVEDLGPDTALIETVGVDPRLEEEEKASNEAAEEEKEEEV